MLEAVEAKDMAQSELDDLLTVLGDMEDKVARYKVRRCGPGTATRVYCGWHGG